MCFKGNPGSLDARRDILPLSTTTYSPQAWVFAHIQLTPEEVAQYKNSPVVYDGDYGFFFEPNE